VPLNYEVTYEMTQPFAKALAELASQQMPDRVVSEMAKTLRRGKVFIDWSQNSDFKTTVCVYAMRAKTGEPFISMPVSWKELSRAVQGGKQESLSFTPADAIKRIARIGDLFEPVLRIQQKLPSVFTEALAAGPPQKLSSWPHNRGKVRDKSLREYAAKRDHSRTPEPAALPGHEATDERLHRFVIQKDRREEGGNKWLLIKAGESLPPFSGKIDDSSVVSGRSLNEIAEANDAQWQSNRPAAPARKKKDDGPAKRVEATFIEPMHCKTVAALPEDEQWGFEIKFDGYRCIAVRNDSEITLFSRNRNALNDRFPNIVEALRSIDGDFVLDGEIVALDGQGKPSFSSSRTLGLLCSSLIFISSTCLTRTARHCRGKPSSDGVNG
jgi:hypothetical protein